MKRALTKQALLVHLGLFSCLLVVVGALPAKALMPAPPPIPTRVAVADLIVVGKVTGFGAKTVPAERFKGDEDQYQIALVQVQDTLLGKAGKEIQVGFIPPPNAPAGGPIRISSRRFGINLSVGQEACLFLTKHPTKEFYTVNTFADVLDKNGNDNYAKEIEAIRHSAKLLANPMAGLESKNKDDRYLAAAMLLTRYRTPKVLPGGGQPKEQPIDAAESKLILEALAEIDWRKPAPTFSALNPLTMFLQLGLTPADGWTQPKNFRDTIPEAQAWLKANAGKYRIKRFVTAETKPEEPSPEPK